MGVINFRRTRPRKDSDYFQSKAPLMDYYPNKDYVLEKRGKGVLKFAAMEDRNYRKSIYSKKNVVPDEYNYFKGITDGFSKQGHVRMQGPAPNIKAQRPRDMRMYKQTEAFQNIANDNEKYQMVLQFCAPDNLRNI